MQMIRWVLFMVGWWYDVLRQQQKNPTPERGEIEAIEVIELGSLQKRCLSEVPRV